MTNKGFLVLIIALFVALFRVAYAQQAAEKSASPRDQLQQYVAELQKKPDDQALREKIIKLALTLEPKPAIPKEANRPFVMAVTFQKEAKDAAGYELAIKAYNEALLLAPWWPEAYWNLSVAQEAAGRYDDAMRTLKLYLLTNPQDASEAETRLYALEAKKQLAEKERGKDTKKAEEARRNSLEGYWAVENRPSEEVYHIFQKDGVWHGWSFPTERMLKIAPTARVSHPQNLSVTGRNIRFREYCGGECYWDVEYELSADGRRLEGGRCTGMQFRDRYDQKCSTLIRTR